MKVLTQEQIAKKLKYMSCRQVASSMGGVTGAYLNFIRNGQANPSEHMRERLTKFFIENGYGGAEK